ncbi:MAG TPA: hypothetical protein VEX15_21765 [Nocardioidaceae bacterium]|nr:hypothetical protein [Nocardioidaceae bacterium]
MAGLVTGEQVRLEGFLAAAQVTVLDVTRGAVTGTRRLLVGFPESFRVEYVVAVPDHAEAAVAVDGEVRILTEVRARTTPPVQSTLPEVVAFTAIDDRPAVVFSAPGTPPPRLASQPPLPDYLAAMTVWLNALWRSTQGLVGPVDLGRYAADEMLARYAGSRRLAPVLGAVYDARRRVARLHSRRTAVHGCLCVAHTYVADDAVVSVDDWSLGAVSGESLNDVGGLAVRIAGARLPEVLTGQTPFAQTIRDFVISGLAGADLPPTRWCDVLILAQAERAMGAVEYGVVDEIGLLARAVRALPAAPDEPEAAS